MPLGLLGKKIGMSQVFDETGTLIPVTLLQVGPCPILLKREEDRDGYVALQIGFDPKPDRLVNKPEIGLYEKLKGVIGAEDRDRILATKVRAGGDGDGGLDEARKRYSLGAMRYVREVRLDDVSTYEVGQVLDVSLFNPGDRVDVTANSKGRGFAGVVKRHGATPGPNAHGSMYHRRPGSMGGSSDPSRVYKRKALPGRMGDSRVTALNLRVVKTDPERNLLFVCGSVPGAPNGYVYVRQTVKKRRKRAKTHLV